MELLLDTATTSTSETPVTSDTANCSGWGAPYLHKLAHLDMQLYYDFYAVWVSLMVCNGVMLVLGVVLNGLALYVFCGPHHTQSASAVYTVNLAVADLLVALSLPARIALYHSGGRCEACAYVHAFSYFVNMYCSILFLTSICIDRYLAVVHASCTLLPWRSTGAARCVSVVVWTLAVVVTYSFQTTALELSTSCVVLPALLYITILEFLLPLLAVVGFTLRVACFLSTGGGLTAHQHSRARKARAIKLLTAVLLVFTVCFTPFHVRQVLVYSGVRVGAEGHPATGHVLAYHITVTLSSLNSCLDPVVYCLVTDSFKRVWRARRRQREAGFSKSAGAAVAIAHRVAALTLTSAPTTPDTAVVDHKHAHECASVGTVQ